MEPVASTMSVPNEDDDGSLSVAVAQAKEAASLFQSGNYFECLTILNQLLQLKPNDPKVRHNIVVTEQFQDGCNDPKKLIEAFENIKKQSEKLSHASGEHLEVSDSNGIDEFDTSAAVFNIAVLWFHLQEYANSFSCLDTLYQNIRRIRIMDEGTALRICLCLLDVALLSHHAPISLDVISYMEKDFCGNTLINPVDSAATAQQQSLLSPKLNLLSVNPSTTSDALNSDSGILEHSLARSLSEEEALDDEQIELPSTLDMSRQRGQTEESSSATDLRLKLHLYKVRLMLLTRNLKVAKREIKLAMNVARGKDYPMALYLKSQLEYARGNNPKAIKLLMASGNHNETGMSSMYYNNLGCIYYQLGKHQISGEFFSKALSKSCAIRKGKPKNLLTFSQDKSLMITYNCGVHSLATGRPFLAFQCFQTASRFFHKKPLLWMRIAECCLMALEKGLIKSPYGSDKSDIRVDVIGEGKWRQLALQSGNLRQGQSSYVEEGDLFSRGTEQTDLSLSLGRQCLYNAMYLLDANNPKYDVSPVSKESESNDKIMSNGEVKDQKGDLEYICMEKQMMKQAALADLAYIELALENPLKALKTARSLLELPECSKMYIFLGIIYAAEALCLLNRLKEAAEQLMVYVSGGNDMALPYTQDDCKKWAPVKVVEKEEPNGTLWTDETRASVFIGPKEARGIFYVNYAAKFALEGDLEQAHYYANQALSDIPNNHKAILTAVYVDLKRGDTKEALNKLKQHKGVRLLPDGLTLKGSSLRNDCSLSS